jgi:uncharacterized protein (TIRG00374 family)
MPVVEFSIHCGRIHYGAIALKRWQFWLGVLVSVFFLWLALRGLDLSLFWETIKAAKYAWLVPAILAYFGAVWARTWRWHYMLRGIKPIPTARLFPTVCIGYMGNNIFPGRAGELLRAYVLKMDEGIAMSASIATILVERIFDGLVMLLFVFITLPLVPDLNPDLRQLVILASLVFFAALVMFLALASAPTTARRVYVVLISRLVPARFREKLLTLADLFMEGLVGLRHGRDLTMTFLTSIVVWLLETVKYWFVMHAFPFEVSFFALMLMNGLANLALTVPAAPGGIGPFDWAGIETLAAFNVERTLASAYTLVLHVALWLPITLLGAYFFLRKGLSWQEAARVRGEEAAKLETSEVPG